MVALGLASVPLLSVKCSDPIAPPPIAADAGYWVSRDRGIVPPVEDASDPDAFICTPPPGPDGYVHDWPGWRRTSEFDKCCPADMLEDLSQAIPYEWVPCDDAAVGCLRFNARTTDSINKPVLQATMARGSSGEAGQMIVTRSQLVSNSYENIVYELPSGAMKGAWRFGANPHCFGGITAALADSALLWHVLYSVPAAPSTGTIVANGSIDLLTQSPKSSKTTVPWDNVNTLYSTNRAAFAFLSGAVMTCDLSGGSPSCISANVASIAPAGLNGYDEFFLEGDFLYALSTGGSAGWSQEYVVGPNGDTKLLRGVPNTHVGALASDGKNLTWVEVQGDPNLLHPQSIEEVWSAPLTRDPSQLAKTAKKLATLPKAGRPAGGHSSNGYYSISAGGFADSDFYVVRVIDGTMIKSPPPPAPYRFYGVFYITSTELWIEGEYNSSIQLFRLTLPPWP